MGNRTGIGGRIHRLRTERGLTQKQLAEPRYTAAFVSSVESGRRRPSSDAVHYFADRLGVDVDELVTGRGQSLGIELDLRLVDAAHALSAGERPQAQEVYARVEREAAALGLTAVQARARLGLGQCELHQGRIPQAAEHFEAAEELLADEPLPARVPALAGRALCVRRSGDLRYAAYLLESALDELAASGLTDPTAMLVLHSNLVAPYFDLGAHEKASAAAAEALALAPQVADLQRVAHMHCTVARVFVAQHRFADAEASLVRAHEAYRQLNLRTEIGQCRWARGYMLAQAGRLTEAADELAAAREIFRQTGGIRDLAGVATGLAEMRRRLGQLQEAEKLLDDALGLLAGGADVVILAEVHRELGQVAEDLGDLAKSETSLRTAAELYERAESRRELALTLRLLGDLLRDQKRLDEAAHVYRDGLIAVEGPT